MRSRVLIAIELALILPAALFMTALMVRNLSPLQDEPAHTAHQLVMWYSGRMWTLWVLLLALPMTVLVTGVALLRRNWNRDPQLALQTHRTTLLLALITLGAGGILTFVALHMAAN